MPPGLEKRDEPPSPDALALFAALLFRDDQRALELLPGSATTAPGGLTTLHAAAAGRCCGAVLAAAVAAGAPLEARLEQSARYGALSYFLGQTGCPQEARLLLLPAFTALGMASRSGDAAAVTQLLQLGADPFAMLVAEAGWTSSRDALRSVLVDAFNRGDAGVQAAFVTHLEQQRAAGALQLRGADAALALLRAAAAASHPRLAAHSIAALEGRCSADRATASQLWYALRDAACCDSGGTADVLRLLLASGLPFNVNDYRHGQPLLALAAVCGNRAATVPMLHAAGARLDLNVLLRVVQRLNAEGVAALLAYARPAADASCVDTYLLAGESSYTCPIHCALLTWSRMNPWGRYREQSAALRTLEVLLAAGYRPTVWHNVHVPPLFPQTFGFTAAPLKQLPRFDPFDHYPAQGVLSERLAFVARGGGWSPATHRYWPHAFKAATRTLLLAGACGSGTGRRATCLAALPGEVLQRILELAAAPMSAWLGADEAS